VKRITIRRGRMTRRFVLAKPPYCRVGDEVTIKGEGAEWFVSKVQELKAEPIVIQFQSGALSEVKGGGR
jgi:hypothetical protein